MKVLLDIKDSKADFVMELLGSFSFVKAETLTRSKQQRKAEVLAGLKGAMKEVKLIKAGKAKGIPLQELLDEL